MTVSACVTRRETRTYSSVEDAALPPGVGETTNGWVKKPKCLGRESNPRAEWVKQQPAPRARVPTPERPRLRPVRHQPNSPAEAAGWPVGVRQSRLWGRDKLALARGWPGRLPPGTLSEGREVEPQQLND